MNNGTEFFVINEADETKFERFKRKASAKFHDATEWVVNNKETLAIITPFAVGGLKIISVAVKSLGKRMNTAKEEAQRNLRCYDPSEGHYWYLKRELTNKEWLDVDRRHKNGERLSEILEELRVLK